MKGYAYSIIKLLYGQQQISTVWLQFIAIVNTKMKS